MFTRHTNSWWNVWGWIDAKLTRCLVSVWERVFLMVLIRLRPWTTIGVYIILFLNETGLNPIWANPRVFGDRSYCQTSFGCQDSVMTTRWSPQAKGLVMQFDSWHPGGWIHPIERYMSTTSTIGLRLGPSAWVYSSAVKRFYISSCLSGHILAVYDSGINDIYSFRSIFTNFRELTRQLLSNFIHMLKTSNTNPVTPDNWDGAKAFYGNSVINLWRSVQERGDGQRIWVQGKLWNCSHAH